MKSFIKNKLFYFILGGIVFSSISVYAAITLTSSSVAYSNSNSGITSTNVQSAIDELYQFAQEADNTGDVVKAIFNGSVYTKTVSFDKSPNSSFSIGTSQCGSKSASGSGTSPVIYLYKDPDGNSAVLSSIKLTASIGYYSDGSATSRYDVYLYNESGTQLDHKTNTISGSCGWQCGGKSSSWEITFNALDFVGRVTDGFYIVATTNSSGNKSSCENGVTSGNGSISDITVTYATVG